ncbi:MAG: glycosyltransferase [Verrucomicrobiae bacterium]|nr:glycosyltransferase [Verrucomicrobiae bacterium]
MILPEVSVVIRSHNDAGLIGRTLAEVDRQKYPHRIQRIHIDNDSTDGTREAIEKFGYGRLLHVPAGEYVPGRVLNQGMEECSDPWVVFLNSDAPPTHAEWLQELMTAAVSRPKIGAAFSRQIPRPDCEAVYAHDYDRCFGPNRESDRWPHFFSMVSSVVNREAWEQHRFREDLQYSEDEEWTYRLKRNGWEIQYAERSVVEHSHNYTFAQAYRRKYGEGFALPNSTDRGPGDFGFVRSVVLGVARDAIRDFQYCSRQGRLAEWLHACAIRYAQRSGARRGFLDGWLHYRHKGR